MYGSCADHSRTSEGGHGICAAPKCVGEEGGGGRGVTSDEEHVRDEGDGLQKLHGVLVVSLEIPHLRLKIYTKFRKQ